jgi:hypothetical protein
MIVLSLFYLSFPSTQFPNLVFISIPLFYEEEAGESRWTFWEARNARYWTESEETFR